MSSLTRRIARASAAITGVLALSLVATAPSSALESPFEAVAADSDLVGAPRHVLIESVHAAGKVLEIGNDRAEVTGATEQPAAAAIFSLQSEPAALAAQSVVAYPLTGSDDTYVFANAAGGVLTRLPNDDAAFRYLEVSDMSIAEAAADAYAQWTLVDAGGDAVFIRNVQPDGEGRTAGLDMYNWKTEDASEIQTYDAGTAAVQKWIVHPVTATTTPLSARTEPGTIPALPTAVDAVYGWGRTHSMTPIAWDLPDDAVWNTEGTVVVTGTGVGYFGESVPVSASYLVGAVGDAVDATMTAHVGISIRELRMSAPTVIQRRISGSDETVTAPVAWDWSVLEEDATAAEGVLEIPATAATGFPATLLITVVATDDVNVLREAGVHEDYTFKDGTGFALTDGNRDVTGFADWRSGGAENRVNPNSVSFYFDVPRQITGAAVFDVAGTRNIGEVTVQYRTILGGWADLPASDVTWPVANTTDDLRLEVDSDRVLATGVRVVIGNKSSSTWMSLSEIEVYGPAAADIR